MSNEEIMKILIVDLDHRNEKLFKDILERYKFNEHQSSTIKKAKALLNEFHPHLIVMSLYKKDEWEFLDFLKNSEIYKSIPVVGITGSEKKRDEVQEKYDLLEVFVEPVKLKNVRHAIQRWTHYGTLYREPTS